MYEDRNMYELVLCNIVVIFIKLFTVVGLNCSKSCVITNFMDQCCFSIIIGIEGGSASPSGRAV